jgi:hypothetical protein
MSRFVLEALLRYSLLRHNTQYSSDIFPASTTTVPYPEAKNITVGDGFYQAVAHLPSGMLPQCYCTSRSCITLFLGNHVIWGVNFGQNNLTAAYLGTTSLIKAFASSAVKAAGITLDFIEIGNEADLYSNNGARNSSTWTITEYIKEYASFFLLTKLY